MCHAPRRPRQFDYLLKRDVLILHRGQGPCPYLSKQFTYAEGASQVQADNHSVCEEADQVLDIEPFAVRRRHSNKNVRLDGEPRHQRCPGAKQGHEQSYAVTPAEHLQLSR